MKVVGALAGALLLGGCATTPCDPPHVYQDASTAPALIAPPGLLVPPSDPTLAIPDVPPGAPEFVSGETGSDQRRCLAVPPSLPAENAPEPLAALRG